MSYLKHVLWSKDQARKQIAGGDLRGAYDGFLANIGRGVEGHIHDPAKLTLGEAAVAASDGPALRAWVDAFEEPPELVVDQGAHAFSPE
jgi:hypothetical protein